MNEVFFVNPNGYAALMYFSGVIWNGVWGNGGNGNLNGQWSVSSSDEYHAFDYNGDGVDELLCINRSNSIAKILSFNGSVWSTVWASSNGTISTRPINDGSIFRVNKFKETGNVDQLMILKNSSPYYASLHEFSAGNGWSELWNNGGVQSITSTGWQMGTVDAYVAPERHLVAVNSTWAMSARFDWYPNIPQNVAVGPSNNHPQVTWTRNSEPDIAGYDIYRDLGSDFGLIATASASASSYIDVDLYIGSTTRFSPYATYYVVAKDVSTLQSPASRPVSISYSGAQRKNIAVVEMPKDFSMDQNYPNPFNPSTTISYGIPDAGTVHLVVYDNLGREVITLVNEYKNAGYYQANFDAGKLSSGIYIYKLQSGNFTSVKKMQMVK